MEDAPPRAAGGAPAPGQPGEAESDEAEAARRKKLQDSKFADGLSKKHARGLMIAAGFRPGPNVSLQHAIDTFKARQFRDIILYSIFLFSFTVSSYTQRDVLTSHLYVNSVKSVVMNRPFEVVPFFKAFRNITRQDDVWGYLESVLPAFLFEETWYNGEPLAPAEQNAVLQVNHLVQAPRLRQVRVQSYKCKDGPGGITNVFRAVPKRLEQYLIDCYPAVGGTEWAHDEILPGWPPGNTVKYRSGPELHSEYYSSQYETYEGGGFAIDIPLNTTQAEVRKMMRHLKENKWSDSQTRAIFFDFATYHMPERFFLSVRLVFEFLPIGEVVPTESFRTLRLGFIDNSQYASLVFDGLVHLILCRFIYEDAERLFSMPKYWLRDLWNYLSLYIYFVFGVSLIFKVRFFVRSLPYVNSLPDELDQQRASLDFEALGWIENQIWNWTALNSVLVWIRAFRFLVIAPLRRRRGVPSDLLALNAGIQPCDLMCTRLRVCAPACCKESTCTKHACVRAPEMCSRHRRNTPTTPWRRFLTLFSTQHIRSLHSSSFFRFSTSLMPSVFTLRSVWMLEAMYAVLPVDLGLSHLPSFNSKMPHTMCTRAC